MNAIAYRKRGKEVYQNTQFIEPTVEDWFKEDGEDGSVTVEISNIAGTFSVAALSVYVISPWTDKEVLFKRMPAKRDTENNIQFWMWRTWGKYNTTLTILNN